MRVRQQLRNLKHEIAARAAVLPRKVRYDVPFTCQFASPESAERSLRKEILTAQDPDWAATGASSPERYAEWAFTMCGMASLAMALGYFHRNDEKPAVLAEDALRHGVYLEEADGISGMRYREFAAWVNKYGLTAQVYSRLSIAGLRYALAHRQLVMVSVNPNIRGYDTAPPDQKGGHLVLMTGYDMDEGTVSLNNPSGFTSTLTQMGHTLSIREFEKYYAGRGIALSP